MIFIRQRFCLPFPSNSPRTINRHKNVVLMWFILQAWIVFFSPYSCRPTCSLPGAPTAPTTATKSSNSSWRNSNWVTTWSRNQIRLMKHLTKNHNFLICIALCLNDRQTAGNNLSINLLVLHRYLIGWFCQFFLFFFPFHSDACGAGKKEIIVARVFLYFTALFRNGTAHQDSYKCSNKSLWKRREEVSL